MRSLGIVLVFAVLATGFTACTLGGPSGGYAFVDARIEPLSDRSGLILIRGTGDDSTPVATYTSIITLENRMLGAADDVRIEVSNVNPGIMDFSHLNEQRVSLAPFEDPDGADWFALIESNVPIYEPKNEYSTQLRYHMCARSRTFYQGTVCMAPPLGRHEYTPTCNPEIKRIEGGQQAPVAVTSIRQADAIDTVSVFIDVVNFGPGLVFDYSDSCARIPQEAAGHIEITALEIGGERILDSCQTSARMGFTHEYQKHTGTTFTCVIDKNARGIPDWDSTITTDLSIELSYGYHVVAGTQPIIIRKI